MTPKETTTMTEVTREALLKLLDERAASYGALRQSSLTAIALDRAAAALTTAQAEAEALRKEVEALRNHADMLAQLLAKSCGDISALLIFGNREGDIRPWTAEYTQAINVHDAHFAPPAALERQS